MAVVNTLSTNAAPLTHPQTAGQLTGQRTKKVTSLITTTAADSAGSTYLICQLPANAVVDNINLHCADIASMNDNDVGLYDMNGVVKVGNYFGDALDLSQHASGCGTAKYASTFNHLGMSNVVASTAEDNVWKNAGDVEGPYPASGSTIFQSKYQLGLLANAGPTAAVTIVCEVEYHCPE
ncbi:MAG: hypothetical protein KGL39_50790 [Patescibacteria group bacterium]|nr:hypothetical protein [Patescibacteria group bacterium]